MRIGLVTGEYPPMEGGVGAFTEQLAKALAGETHIVHIMTAKKARPADAPRQLSALREPYDLGFAQLHSRMSRWRWPELSTIAEIAIRYDLEIINIQYQAAAYNMRSPALNYLPWRLKGILPTVTTYHDLRVPYLFPKAGRVRQHVVRAMARRSAGCIATNMADYHALEKWTDTPVRRIPIGSNIDTYQPNHIEIAEVRDNFGLSADDILLGYFGFLNETKGADTLIDALALLDSRYHLVFIGGQTGASDSENNQAFLRRLQSQIDDQGLSRRVHWTGFLPPVRVSAHLGAADLMVMPYQDGVSLRRGTLMAVLAHGRPLITTHPVEETPEIQHGTNMWCVPPAEAAVLAEAITRLSANTAMREALGRGAKELSLLFRWDVIAAHTAEFFAELVANPVK